VQDRAWSDLRSELVEHVDDAARAEDEGVDRLDASAAIRESQPRLPGHRDGPRQRAVHAAASTLMAGEGNAVVPQHRRARTQPRESATRLTSVSAARRTPVVK